MSGRMPTDEVRLEVEGAIDFSKLPDPVWTGMSAEEFKRIAVHVRYLADLLGLKDWRINMPWTPLKEEENAYAHIGMTEGRKVAVLHLDRDFGQEDDDTKHRCLIHELLHIHVEPLHTTLEDALPKLIGSNAWAVVDSIQRERIEHLVDLLAESLGNYMPGLPKPKKSKQRKGKKK